MTIASKVRQTNEVTDSLRLSPIGASQQMRWGILYAPIKSVRLTSKVTGYLELNG